MKRIFYIVLMLVPLMFTGAQSYAMPPHPDLLKKWKEDGTLEKNIKRVQSVSTRKSMNINKTSPIGSGIVKIPVILIRYADVSFKASSTVSFYSNMLNGVNDTDLSAKKYYKDMSAGSLVIEFTVFNIVNAVNNDEYYGANDADDNDLRPGTLVHEAVDAVISANPSVDFSQFDNDNNGYIDTVIIIHAGAGEETSGTDAEIWSHQWTLASAQYYGDGEGVVTTDGVTFDVYTIQPEYVVTAGDSTIGVFCHELGHVFGLPDLYDTTYETNGVGNWSLMASGSWGGGDGSRPAPLLAWERYFIGGSSWVEFADIKPVALINYRDHGPVYLLVIFIVLLAASAALLRQAKYLRTIAVPGSLFMLMIAVSCSIVGDSEPVIFDGAIYDIESSHEVYRIPLVSGQYLILEGKKAATTSGWYVPGTGVLVTHVHEGIISSYYSSNTVNAGYDRVHGITVVEAKTSFEPGKLRDTDTDPLNANTYYGSADDLFCLENKSAISVSTTPGTDYYRNESVSSKTGDSGASITSFSSRTAWPITFHAEY